MSSAAEPTSTDYPRTTPAALRRAARNWPGGTAIVDGQWGADVALNWAELHEAVHTFAAALVASGIGAGDRVAIWAPNSHHWPVAALGTHYAGAVLVPLNTRYTAGEAVEIIERSAAAAVVVSGEFLGADHRRGASGQASRQPAAACYSRSAEQIRDSGGAVGWTEFLDRGTDESAAEAERRADGVSPDDLSDIMFTSGTTGKSKGVMATHRQTLAGSHAWGANGRLNSDDRYLMVNPYFHTFGYKAGIAPCVLFGVTMLPLAVYSPTAAMELASRQRATVFPGAPTVFQTILDDPDRTGHDLSSLRLVVTGAAIVPVVLIDRIAAELGVDTVITAYGLTECSGFVSTCTADDDAVTVANTCGRAFAGMEIALSEQGEVLARGDMVMVGYLDDPDATAATIDADGWLHTGDIGTIDERGNLKITDRLKDMYICGGFNVYPAEVEQVLARIDGVTESAVIGVPDERLGEVGKAFLTVRADAVVEEDAVIAYCREHLANFKVPRSVRIVDTFPATRRARSSNANCRSRTEPRAGWCAE